MTYRAQRTNEQNIHIIPSRKLINPLFPLRRFASCSTCGVKLTGSAPQGKSRKYPYYHHGSHQCSAARNIPKQELEEQFLKQLARFQPKPDIFKLARVVIIDQWKTRIENNIKQEKDINRRIAELKSEKATLLELKRQSPQLYTDEEFLEQKHDLDHQINTLELERNDESAIDNNFEQALEVVFSILKDPVTSWQQLEPLAKQKFQNILFPEGMEYDGQRFGTPKLALVLEILQASSTRKSHLVDMANDSWNQFLAQVMGWSEMLQDDALTQEEPEYAYSKPF